MNVALKRLIETLPPPSWVNDNKVNWADAEARFGFTKGDSWKMHRAWRPE